MALVYRDGQLVEEGADDSLQSRLNRVGAPKTAVSTPFGAKSVGASPDAAKMAASPARKQAVLTQATGKKNTAQFGAESQGARATSTSTAEDQIKVQQFQQLSGLTSLQKGVQAKVQQIVNNAGTGAVARQVNEAEVRARVPKEPAATYEQRVTAAVAALNQLSGAVDDAARQQILQQLKTTTGLDTTSGALDVNTLYSTADESVAGAAAESAQNQLTLTDLPPTEYGFQSWADVAGILGIPEQDISGWTVQQLQDRVQQVQQDETSARDLLRERLAGAPLGSAKRMIYQRQLADLDQKGAAVVAQELNKALQSIDLTSTMKIGNTVYDLETVLADDKISDLISKFMAAPDDAAREQLLPKSVFGNLWDWIDQNSTALDTLTEQAGASAEGFEEAQQNYAGLNTLGFLQPAAGDLGGAFTPPAPLNGYLMHALLPDWEPGQTPTASQVQALQQQLQQSPIGQLVAARRTDIVNALNQLGTKGLDDLGDIQGKSVQEIEQMYEAGKDLKDPDLADYVNVPDQGVFVPADIAAQMTAAKEDLVELKKNAEYKAVLKDPAFQSLSAADKSAVSQDPAKFKLFTKYQGVAAAAAKSTLEDKMDALAPNKGLVSYLKNNWSALKSRANAGDTSAAEQIKLFRSVFGESFDGTLDPQKVSELWGSATASDALNDTESWKSSLPVKLLEKINELTKLPTPAVVMPTSTTGITSVPTATEFWTTAASLAEDGKLDQADLTAMLYKWGPSENTFNMIASTLKNSQLLSDDFPLVFDKPFGGFSLTGGSATGKALLQRLQDSAAIKEYADTQSRVANLLVGGDYAKMKDLAPNEVMSLTGAVEHDLKNSGIDLQALVDKSTSALNANTEFTESPETMSKLLSSYKALKSVGVPTAMSTYVQSQIERVLEATFKTKLVKLAYEAAFNNKPLTFSVNDWEPFRFILGAMITGYAAGGSGGAVVHGMNEIYRQAASAPERVNLRKGPAALSAAKELASTMWNQMLRGDMSTWTSDAKLPDTKQDEYTAPVVGQVSGLGV